MARYGVTVYGTDLYGEAPDLFDSTPFTATPVEYSAVFVTWRIPSGDWRQQRLVRSTVGVPQTETDGVIVLDETLSTGHASFFTDTELPSGRWYSYALYVLDQDDGTWRLTGSATTMVPTDYSYTDQLYAQLPAVFEVEDLSDLSMPDAVSGSFLYRFLKVFGYQLNLIRTNIDSLLDLLDARTISLGVLPELASQVGVSYEPEISPRSMRRLVQNAAHLYDIKGTADGIRELSTIVTGWGSDVVPGYNIALDDSESAPSGGYGRWAGVGGTVGYEANGTAVGGPVGDGVLVLTIPAAVASATFGTNLGGTDGFLRKQHAIPILAGRSYVVSMYARAAATPGTVTVKTTVVWLDTDGNIVTPLTPGTTSVTPSATDWSGRAATRAVAPVGAAYLEPGIEIDGGGTNIAAGSVFYLCGFQVEDTPSYSPRPWEPARRLTIALEPESVNEMIYAAPDPSLVGLTSGTTWFTEDTGAMTAVVNAPTEGPSFGVTTSTGGVTQIAVRPAGTFTPTSVGGAYGSGTYGGGVYQAGGPPDVPSFAIPVIPGETIQLMAQAFDPTSGGPVAASFLVDGYDDAGGTVGSLLVEASTDISTNTGYVNLTETCIVPAEAVVIVVGLQFNGSFSSGESIYFNHIGVFRTAIPVDYFDATMVSPTQDYLWEGLQYSSRSHRYSQRTARAARLRDLLSDFIPFGVGWVFSYAQPAPEFYGSSAGIEGSP